MIAAALICSLFTSFAFADDVNQQLYKTLFADIDRLFATAQKEQLRVLSPDTFDLAYKQYSKAQRAFKAGKNIKSIKGNITKAKSNFSKALLTAKESKHIFATTLKARQDAINAGSHKLSPNEWTTAEDEFRSAALDYESDPNGDFLKLSGEAEKIYRTAELNAIKTSMLDETKRLLKQAKKDKVDRFAPITFNNATRLLKNAEALLIKNRYDMDEPRSVLKQASYEAKHAIYLAGIAKQVDKRQKSIEQIVLDYEQPLLKISGAADVVAKLDTGYESTTNEVVTKITETDRRATQQAQDLRDMEAELKVARTTIASMDKELGTLSSERIGLKRIKKQREQAQRIENMFTRDEALVLRKGNSIILRLVGVSFKVGRSDVLAEDYALINKVEQAVNVFNKSIVTVEGHTDSFGADDYNLNLSNERAEAVKNYMIANLNLNNASLLSMPYGEGRPIANNETEQGRERNRRIDIVISPR